MLTFETLEQSLEPPGVSLTTFDLVFTWRERASSLELTCLYKTALFQETTIVRLLDTLQTVLESLCTQPERQPVTFRSHTG